MNVKSSQFGLTGLVAAIIIALSISNTVAISYLLHNDYDGHLTESFMQRIEAEKSYIGHFFEHELKEVGLQVDSLVNHARQTGSEKRFEERLRSLQTVPPGAVVFASEGSPPSVRASADISEPLRNLAIRLAGESTEGVRLYQVGERQVVFAFTSVIRSNQTHRAVVGAFYNVSHGVLPPKALVGHQGRRLVAKIDGVHRDIISGEALRVQSSGTWITGKFEIDRMSIGGVRGTFAAVPGFPQVYYFAPTSSLDHTRRHNLTLAATGVLIFSIVSIAIAFFLSRKIMGPLQSLVASARQIASGDHSDVGRPEWSRISELSDFQHSLFETVTQLKQAEESIRENEERLRAIFESSPIGVGISKLKDGTIRFSNDRNAEIFRLPAEEFIGSTSKSFWADEADRNAFLDIFREHGRVPTREARLKRADGSVFWCHLCWEAITFRGEDHILFWIYDLSELKEAERNVREARDLFEKRVEERTAELQREIAERVRTENQLRESESYFRAFIDSTPSSILIKDLEGRYLIANKCWHERFNPEHRDICGQTVYDHFPKDYADVVDTQDRLVARERRLVEQEIETPYADGTSRASFLQKFPVVDENGILMAIGGINTDITERKLAEKLLRDAKEQAVSASLAKSEFLAHMGHELRTPLNSIIGFSQILAGESFGKHANPRYAEYSEDVLRSSQHLLAVINDILDISRIEAGETELDEENTDIAEEADTCFRMIEERRQAKEIKIDRNIENGLPRLRSDKRHIKQILLNLLTNAVKFTPPGGTVSFQAEAPKNNGMCIRIADTGVGISPEHLDRVLEPFAQVNDNAHIAHDGTGLGLAISHRLVQLHGGALTIESEVGRGTTVSIQFPAERSVWQPCDDPSRPDFVAPEYSI